MQKADHPRSFCLHNSGRKWWLAVTALLLALLLMFMMSPMASAEEGEPAVTEFVEDAPAIDTTASEPAVEENSDPNLESEPPDGSGGEQEAAPLTVTYGDPSLKSVTEIQNAVDDVISKLTSGDTSKTIQVAEGTYTGGKITIDKTKLAAGVTLSDDFTLIIESVKATSDTATDCGTDVTFQDVNIAIDNLNVNLVGIYFCLNSLIEAKNSKVEVYGTTGNDEVNVELGENSTATVHTGTGTDEVNVTYDGGGSSAWLYIDTGASDAKDSTVNITGKEIAVNGEINAKSINVTAEDTSTTTSKVATAIINGVLTAENDITLVARNVLNISNDEAVNAAKAYTGITVNGTVKSTEGKVDISSSSDISVTSAAAASLVTAVSNDSFVKLASGSKVEGNSVSLKSAGTISTAATATVSGSAGGNAVSAVRQNVATEVSGATVNAVNGVVIEAESDTDVSGAADGQAAATADKDIEAAVSGSAADYADMLNKAKSAYKAAVSGAKNAVVNYIEHSNKAVVSGSAINADDLTVKAVSGTTADKMNLTANGDGAVQLISIGNVAEISGDSELKLTGELAVESTAYENISTTGKAATSETSAFNVCSKIGDGVKVNTDDSALEALNINNINSLVSSLTAIDSAVRGLMNSGVSTAAYLGSGNKITVTGNVNVTNTSCVDRIASSSSTNVYGSSVSVVTLRDTANSTSSRDIDTTGNVAVNSTSRSRSHNTAASNMSDTSGESSDDHHAETEITKVLERAKALAGILNSGNVTEAAFDELITGRQKAETSECTDVYFLSYALNIISLENNALLSGNVEAGSIEVKAEVKAIEGKTAGEADISAKADGREHGITEYGFFNAVAINQVTYNNVAKLDANAEVKATGLNIEADTTLVTETLSYPGKGHYMMNTSAEESVIMKAPNIAIARIHGDTDAVLSSAAQSQVSVTTLTVKANISQTDTVKSEAKFYEDQTGLKTHHVYADGVIFVLAETAVNAKASVEGNVKVAADAVSVIAVSDHDVTAQSKGGENPWTSTSSFVNKVYEYAFDVNDVVALIGDQIVASIGANANVTVNGANSISTEKGGNAALYVFAKLTGEVLVKEECQDCGADSTDGDRTVYSLEGAVAALLIAKSTVKAESLGTVKCTSGKAVISAVSDTDDKVEAGMAIVGMSELVPYYDEDTGNYYLRSKKLTGGLLDYRTFDKATDNLNNGTQALLNQWLNDYCNAEASTYLNMIAEAAHNELPLSMNLMITQNVRTLKYDVFVDTLREAIEPIIEKLFGPVEDSKFWELVSSLGADEDLTGTIVDAICSGASGNEITYAAASAVSVTEREALATVGGSLNAKGISITAYNTSDFYAHADGETMTKGDDFDCGRAVAVALNRNAAKASTLDKADNAGKAVELNAHNLGIDIHAYLTQNMGNTVANDRTQSSTAYAVSGHMNSLNTIMSQLAASNPVSSMTLGFIGSSIASVSNQSDCAAVVGIGTKIVNGGALTVIAEDQTRLASRAGNVSDKLGLTAVLADVTTLVDGKAMTTTGTSAGHAVIWARGNVRAEIKDEANISASSLSLQALKKAIPSSDTTKDSEGNYLSAFHSYKVLTLNETESSEKGHINIVTEGTPNIEIRQKVDASGNPVVDDDGNAVNEELISIDADALARQILSASYYVEAINGSKSGNDEDYLDGGSCAQLYLYNDVHATIGNDVTINTTGNVVVEANSEGVGRVISGTRDRQTVCAGNGIANALTYNADEIYTCVGLRTHIVSTEGSYTQYARSNYDNAVFATSQLPMFGDISFAPLALLSGGQPFVIKKAADPSAFYFGYNKVMSYFGKDNVTKSAENYKDTLASYVGEVRAIEAERTETRNTTIAKNNETITKNSETCETLRDKLKQAKLNYAAAVLAGDKDDKAKYKSEIDGLNEEIDKLVAESEALGKQNRAIEEDFAARLKALAESRNELFALTFVDGTEADASSVKAYGDVSVKANGHVLSDMALKSFAANFSITAIIDILKNAAVSGTCMSVYLNKGNTKSEIGKYAKLTSENGDISVYAKSSDNATNILDAFTMGASVLPGGMTSSAGKQGATNLIVNFTKTETEAIVGDYAVLTAANDITVLSEAKSVSNAFSECSAIGTKSSGFGIILAWFERTNEATIGAGAKLTAGRNIIVKTYSDEYAIDFAQAFAAAAYPIPGMGGSMTAVVGAIVSMSKLHTTVKNGARLVADGYINVDSKLDSDNNIFSGGVSVSLNSAIGVGVNGGVYYNELTTLVEEGAVLIAKGNTTYEYTDAGGNRKARRGIAVRAIGNEQTFQIVLSVAAAALDDGSSLNGAIDAVVMKNVVKAQMNGTAVAGYESEEDGAAVTNSESDVYVDAEDVASQKNFAGGLCVSGAGAPKGVTVLALVYSKTAQAETGANAVVKATNDVEIRSLAEEDVDLFTIAISVGGAGTGLAGDLNAVVFKGYSIAAAGGKITAGNDVKVLADFDSNFLVIGTGVAGSGTGAGACAVIVFTYFMATTQAYAKSGAVIKAGNDISILSTSSEKTSPDAGGMGVSAAGAGFACTADVIISKIVNQAYTESGVTLDAGRNVTIKAIDNYKLVAVVVCIGASGAGVGVSIAILVSVAFNNVNAWIGADSVVNAGGDVIVHADSTRTIDSISVGAAGSGAGAAAAPSVNVVIAGSKLPQNVRDAMDSNLSGEEGTDEDGESKEVHIDYKSNLSGALKASPDAEVKNLSSTLDTDLEGDGNRVEDIKPSTGDHDGDGNDDGWDGYGQGTSAESQMGGMDKVDEDHPASEDSGNTSGDTSGVNAEQAADVDKSSFNSDNSKQTAIGYNDAASAVIYGGASVTAGHDIKVVSSDVLSTLQIAGSVAASGAGAAIGIGISFAYLSSNVNSSVCENAELTAGNDVLVNASSGSSARSNAKSDLDDVETYDRGDSDAKSPKDRRKQIMDKMNEKEEMQESSSTILLISCAISGAVGPGVSVAAGVLLVTSNVEAHLDGIVNKANNVTVQSTMNYGKVITVVLGVAGSAVGGISASVGLTKFSGTVDSGIGSTAIIGKEAPVAKVEVLTNGVTKATAAAAAVAAAGGAAVSAGVGLVFNRTAVDNYIKSGAYVNAKDGAVNVKTDFDTESLAIIISVSFSAGGSFGATVSVVSNNLTVNNYIGTLAATSAKAATIIAKNVEVKAESKGGLKVIGVGVAGGTVALNGIVSVCFNNVSAKSIISNANINNGEGVNASGVTVDSKLNGDALAVTTGVTGGLVAGGASVVVAKVTASSVAQVNVFGCTMLIDNLKIGESDCNSEVKVIEVSVAGGAVGVCVNVGLAFNKAYFLSNLTGDSTGTLKAGTVDMVMNGKAYTNVLIVAASFGLDAAGSAVSITSLEAVQEAVVNGNAAMTIGTLNVTSTQNTTNPSESSNVNVGHEKLSSVPYTFDTMSQALIISAKFGAASEGINVAKATADATCRAMVMADNLDVSGKITVSAYALTQAKADAREYGVSLVGGTVMVGFTFAKGTIEAVLGTNGNLKAADGVDVLANYASLASTKVKPSMGGLLGGLTVNVAVAKVLSVANALIKGTGTIDAGENDINVIAVGCVVSDAAVEAALLDVGGLKVGVNVVLSVLKATQTAKVSGANVKGGSLKVISAYNTGSYDYTNPSAPSINTAYGAKAVVGAALASAGLANIKVNLAWAYSTSTVRSLIGDANVDVTGDAYVTTFATSYAETAVEEPTFSITGLSAACNYLYSYAQGTYESGIDAGDEATTAVLKAGNMYVYTACNTKAQSVTGGFGAAVGVISVKVNIARAHVRSTAASYAKGSGTIDVAGNMTIKTVGTGHAYSRVIEPVVSLELLGIAASDLISTLGAVQSAYTDFGGTATITGKLSVISEFDCSNTGADSLVGNKAGVSISFYKGAGNTAYSYEQLENKAYLIGKDSAVITVGDAKINATSKTRSNAVALKPVSISAAEVCCNFAQAQTADTTEAYIGNGKEFTLTATGDVEVKANGETTSYTEFASGGAVSLFNTTISDAKSFVGTEIYDEDGNVIEVKKQTVKAYIADNAKVTATGDIMVSAYNKASVSAKMTQGFNVSALAISSNNVITKSYLDTVAYIGQDAKVESVTGEISVLAEDMAEATAKVDGDSVGILLSADNKAAKNYVYQTVTATIMEGAEVTAYGDLNIQTNSNANVTTTTQAVSAGIFAEGSLNAHTVVSRASHVSIKSSSLKSRYNTLNILAAGGRKDNIRTSAKGTAGGLVGIGGANTSNTITNDVRVDVDDSHLNADFGTCSVKANVAEAAVSTNADYSAGGLIAVPLSWAYINNATMNAIVQINNSTVRGGTVDIASELKEMGLSDTTNAKVGGIGGGATAKSELNLYMTIYANVNDSKVHAYNQVNFWSNATPTSSGAHIYITSATDLKALAGGVNATTRMKGYIRSSLNLSNTEVRGCDVSLYSNGFDGYIYASRNASGKGLAVIRSGELEDSLERNAGASSLTNGTIFYVSGGALGIRAEADILGIIHYIGSRDSIGGIASEGVLTVTGKLTPFCSGSLIAPGLDLTGIKIINCNEPTLYFENHFKGNLVLPAMDLSLSKEEIGDIRVEAAAHDPVVYQYEGGSHIYITSYEGGDVSFGNVVCNENGETVVEWVGEAGNLVDHRIDTAQTYGGVDFALLWTHKFIVKNVHNVGESTNTYELDENGIPKASKANNTYFQVLMTIFEGEDAKLSITDATGDIYIQPVLANIVRSTELNQLPTASPTHKDGTNGKVDIVKIQTAGRVDISFVDAMALNYMPGAGAITVEMANNALIFVYQTKNLSATIDYTTLQRYYVKDEDNGVKLYELPDKSKLRLDASGKFLSIDGYECDEYISGRGIVLDSELVDGEYTYVTFNPSTGTLRIDAKYPNSFDLYSDSTIASKAFNGVTTITCADIEGKDDEGKWKAFTLEELKSKGIVVNLADSTVRGFVTSIRTFSGDLSSSAYAWVENVQIVTEWNYKQNSDGTYVIVDGEKVKTTPKSWYYEDQIKYADGVTADDFSVYKFDGTDDAIAVIYKGIELLGVWSYYDTEHVSGDGHYEGTGDNRKWVNEYNPSYHNLLTENLKYDDSKDEYVWSSKRGDSSKVGKRDKNVTIAKYEPAEGDNDDEGDDKSKGRILGFIFCKDDDKAKKNRVYRLSPGKSDYIVVDNYAEGFDITKITDDEGNAKGLSVTFTTDGVNDIVYQVKKNSSGSYTITQDTSIRTDGTIVKNYGDVTIESNPGSNSFKVSYADGSSFNYTGSTKTVQLGSKNIRLELITPTVAKTVDGSYWYYVGYSDGWQKATRSGNTISYNGTPILGMSEKSDGSIEFTTYERGVAQFRYTKDTNNEIVTTGEDDTGIVDLVENRPITMSAKWLNGADDASYFNLGEIESGVGKTGVTAGGEEIWLRYDGQNIVISATQTDSEGNAIINIKSPLNIYEHNYKQADGEYAEVTKGSENKYIEIDVGQGTGRDYNFRDENTEQQVIGSDDNEHVYFDAHGNDYEINFNMIVEKGGSYELVIKNANIIVNNSVYVDENGSLTYRAIAGEGKEGDITFKAPVNTNGYVQVNADGSVVLPELTVLKGGNVDINAYNGTLTGNKWVVNGQDTSGNTTAKVTATVYGDILFYGNSRADGKEAPIVVKDGAEVNLNSTTGGFYGSYAYGSDGKTLITDDDKANLEIYQADNRVIPVENGSIYIQVAKDLVITLVELNHGTASLESTEKNVYFDRINAHSNVIVAAGENIDVLHGEVDKKDNHAVIHFEDRIYEGTRYDGTSVSATDKDKDGNDIDLTSTLILRAGKNIGRPDRWIYIDVPSNVTPVIQVATNFYIDAQAQSLLDWDLYKYWVTSGYGVDKINIGFDEYVTGTAVDYLSYSDVTYFRSLLDLDDNTALAQWIMTRSDDVNASKNSFYKYADLDTAILYLAGKEAGEELTVKDVESAISKADSISAELAAILDEDYKAEVQRREDAEEPELTPAEAVEFLKKSFKSAMDEEKVSSDVATAVLTAMLDEGIVSYDESLTNLVNYLFKTSSFYSTDLQSLLDAAAEESGKNLEKAQAAMDANEAELDAAENALTEANSNQTEILDAIHQAISAAFELSSSVKKPEEKTLPGSEDFKAVYSSAMDSVNAYLASVEAAAGDEKAEAEALKTLKDELKSEFESLSKQYKDFKPAVKADTSAKNISELAESYVSAKASVDTAISTYDSLRDINRALSQRLAEVSDSYQTEKSMSEIAQRLNTVLKDGGEWDKAVKALTDAKDELEAARDAYEVLKSADSYGEAQTQAKERMLKATAAYEAASDKYVELYTEVYTLANTHYDQQTRSFSLNAGEIYGEANLYNTGDISITVDPQYAHSTVYKNVQERAEAGEITVDYTGHTSDIILANIRSENGDVSVVNNGGSIYGADLKDISEDQTSEWIYRNDGKDYEYRYDRETGKWYDANGEEMATPAWDSAFTRNWFAGTTEEFQNSLVKNFENVHVYGNDITLIAEKNLGTKDNVILTESHATTQTKVANASTNTDPFGIGKYWRFDDYQINIYDQISGNRTNYIKQNLAELIEEIYVLDAKRETELMLAGEGSILSAVSGEPVEAAAKAYGAPEVNLVEYTFADGTRTWGIEVSVRHDWVRTNDVESAGKLNIAANNGELWLNEYAGDINGGSITAGEDATVNIPGYVSTSDNRMDVQVGGELNLNAGKGSMYLRSHGSLILNGYCPDSHYEIDTVETIGGKGSITLNDMNKETEVLTGYTKSMGDVTITTRGDIGTSDEHFVIANTVDDSSVGIVSFKGLNTYITGVREDGKPNNIALNECVVDGDLVLNNSGDVLNKNNGSGSKYNDLMNDLVAKQEAYNEASDDLDKAEALKASVDNLTAKENVEKAEIAKTSAESALSDAKLTLEKAENEVADAEQKLEDQRKLYEEKLKAKTATEADLTELVKVEEELAQAEEIRDQAAADVKAAEQTLKECEQTLSDAQTYWDGMEDYKTRELEAADQRIEDATADLADAQKKLDEANEAYDAVKDDPSVSEEKKAAAKQAVTDATAERDEAQKALNTANDDKTALEGELDDLLKYASDKVADAQKAKDEAAAKLEAQKALVEAQDELNEAESEAQKAELYASEHPEDAEAQMKAEIARNTAEAARYMQSARALINEYANSGTATQEQKDNAQAILEEAEQTMKLVWLGNNYLTNGDAEYAAQNSLTDESSELDKLTAVAEQQKQALAIVESVELLDAKDTQQAETTLHAGKDLLDASEDAYNQQVLLTTRQEELDAAKTELAEAQAAWVKETKNYRLDKGEGELDESKLQKLFKDAENGEKLKAAWLRLKNAEEAVPVAQKNLDDQQKVLDAANAVKETKQDIWTKANELNKAIAAEEKRVADLSAANTEKSGLESQYSTQEGVVANKKQTAVDAINALIGVLDNTGNPDLMEHDVLDKLRDNIDTLTTLSEDEFDDYASQLKNRLKQESKLTEEEISGKLDSVFDAINDYYAERTELTDIGREIEDVKAVITELNGKAASSQKAVSDAQQAQNAVISGLSSQQSGTRAEAAPVTDEAERDDRNTAENPNLKVNGNAVITAGGDFGEADNALGVEVAGTIDLVTGGEIGLNSTKDLDLVRAMGVNDASFTTLGSVNNVSGHDGIIITGEDVTFNAIPGSESDGSHNVGADRAMNIAATGLGGNADNMFVNNLDIGNTELSDLHVVDTAVINLNGSVTQEKDAVLAANNLNLTAKGDIGDANDTSEPKDSYVQGISTPVGIEKKQGAVTVNADNMNISGKSANLHSINPNSEMNVSVSDNISVTAEGNLMSGSNSVLNGKELYLYALGNIGTKFDGFQYTGKLVRCDTVYGIANVKPVVNTAAQMNFIWTDLGGALGFFSKNAKLVITDLKPAGDSDAAELLKKASGVDGYITGYNVKIIDINDKLYNGYAVLMLNAGDMEDSEVVYGLYLRDGKLEVLKGFIRNGYAIFSVNGFDTVDSSSIAIVTEEALTALGLSAGDAVTVVNYTTAYDYYLRVIDQQLAA